ncbi:hypothetical protein A9Q99_07400 [Gammaproteobacteria bacterium 45_16_T64]|nr:hypothetical protein A9Q99_07400 [Gammaproteobacteria bacterium 45_16_T64]
MIALLSGCGGATSGNTSCAPGCSSSEASSDSSSGSTEACFDVKLGAEYGIKTIPSSADAKLKASFCKYIAIDAPNGKPIEIYAQSNISDEQLIRAHNILNFYLESVPGTTYGADKTGVANAMANNQARMLLLNGSDDGTNDPTIDGQPLYDTELIVEGTPAYINNDYENHRDAAFEEILHLMHDYGIGTSGVTGTPGALPGYTAAIDSAQQNASTLSLWPTAGVDSDTLQWIEELRKEGSLSQEYLASVIDSYYGYWGADTSNAGGMMGIYIAKTRAEVTVKDPMGAAIVADYFNPVVTYRARIVSAFQGDFLMAFDLSSPYTHKSQYLVNAQLTGSNDSNLLGNDHDNILLSNAGTNTLDGKGGTDTAVFEGAYDEYSVSVLGTDVVVQDSVDGRNGVTTLVNIEKVTFASSEYVFSNGELVESR